MKPWMFVVKRIADVFVSILALILLAPLILYVVLRVRLSSDGPVIFVQERLGKNRKPFFIRKFRSMFVHSEEEGPQLSAHNDPRVTAWGRTMRRWKLDELPQLWNVIIGDMSIVGPRPERPHYIAQIEKEVPAFDRMLAVRPGMTSLGMVRFGYAENVTEMVTRTHIELQYLENMSLALDMQIIAETLRIIFKGRGR
jgi:lipopolysaccharide/colanic/teichoic acid biosynthesis glycosyltransferase